MWESWAAIKRHWDWPMTNLHPGLRRQWSRFIELLNTPPHNQNCWYQSVNIIGVSTPATPLLSWNLLHKVILTAWGQPLLLQRCTNYQTFYGVHLTLVISRFLHSICSFMQVIDKKCIINSATGKKIILRAELSMHTGGTALQRQF